MAINQKQVIQHLRRKFAQKAIQYTKPLRTNQYKITPPRFVPPEIERPPYVGKNPQEFPDLENDPILILDKDQQDKLRSAAQIAADTLKLALETTKIGMTMDDIDQIVHDNILKHGAYPSAIDYMHFPKSVCTSVNEVVCHGVPNDKVLENGDYINIDIVCYFNGHHGDNSGMVLLGDVHPNVQKLNQVTRESLFAAIDICKPGTKFNQIGETIQEYANSHGFAVNEEFGGHGIAHHMHMAPMVYHHKTKKSSKEEMRPGMAFTIEPVLMMNNNYQYIQWKDGWTISAPGVPSCQWEHIILITEEGHEILTFREGEVSPFAEKKQ